MACVGFRYELDGLCGVQVRACVGFRYELDGLCGVQVRAKNNIIGAVMACITPVRYPKQALARPKRTVREEYCVFLYSAMCKEDYEEQVRCGSRVLREIEELYLNGIDIDLGEDGRKHVKIKWRINKELTPEETKWIQRWLRVKDKFNISDSAFHEIRMLGQERVPPLYRVIEERKEQSKMIPIITEDQEKAFHRLCKMGITTAPKHAFKKQKEMYEDHDKPVRLWRKNNTITLSPLEET
ncbi:Hypp6786 [Branchiostoma lanceolatum]|uniref:Hypp6786 protein n=1 Tax=Branchiostoma lanceolatum TaxID=7740 RepID=A0A8J9YVF4_BRALA|nr:Hypp6786 [Branchiostoma lanceolatum]